MSKKTQNSSENPSAISFSLDEFLNACLRESDFTKRKKFEPGAERFLRSFYSDARENEFLGYSFEDMVKLARYFWMTGQTRKDGEIIISVDTAPKALAPHQETIIQIISDDKSFLVDSVTSRISTFGIDVLGLFHPIVNGFRSGSGAWGNKGNAVTESMILVVVPKQNAKRCKDIKDALTQTLKDVRVINQDFSSLIATTRKCAAGLIGAKTFVSKDVVQEAVTFLNWLADGNFVFLGSRTYNFDKKTESGDVDFANPSIVIDDALGVLRDPEVFVMRQSSEPAVIAANAKAIMNSGRPVTVEKSNLFSNVHRLVRMDFITVKHYDNQGDINGITRFVGLFTSGAYSRDPKFIPLIREKIERVIAKSDYSPTSHSGKALASVLATYPRDELFQVSDEDLFRISVGVAQAYDRPRTRVFARHDPYGRFVSVLVYVPRESYSTRIRRAIGNHLKNAYDGRVSAFYPQYSDAPLARVHFIIGMNPSPDRVMPNIRTLEAEISNLTKPWFERVKDHAEEDENMSDFAVEESYSDSFSTAYQSVFDASDAVDDIMRMERLSDKNPYLIKAYTKSGEGKSTLRAKLYSREGRVAPSRIIPMLANFNLKVTEVTGYGVSRKNSSEIWIHDIEIDLGFDLEDAEALSQVFETAFMATWNGINEDDGFNGLVLPLSVNWREIAFLRMIASYRRQSGLDPSDRVQIEALTQYKDLTRLLISLKSIMFEPKQFKSLSARTKAANTVFDEIQAGLNSVKSLTHDRVFRRLANVIRASLRTNFYQLTEDGQPFPYISVKIASRKVGDLPSPIPYREIFISSPQVEGVHLRFGPVARGGLRWSDRQDDFRTEVLGLVKAQQVKNSVIVPVGSKGGFFPKQLPVNGTRDEFIAEGISAYKTFISSLLSLTDNYSGTDIIKPKNVVCWDDPDPYLVVAADKGTATFSDIANGLSKDFGFWLGDAFASGGSVGYDHKAMGITARGAWEAVKRHFREIGKDIQSTEFTVIGCGDMSGDVFGNGMLLSEHIQLVGAFDHRDIFIDPTPNAAASFKERQRLFNMDRSSWQDYDKSLISKGGGIFPRSAKSIALTDEIQSLTGLKKSEVTPDELINALLKSEVELLWFGGIGTYIKGTLQANLDVGDKANDTIRVNGADVKAQVIGEGANLGVTQAGRIEFAMRGGRLNTDAIDNAAGVDTSDNEVNIKILIDAAIESKEVKSTNREDLLSSMTNDVADLVLRHNYDQTGALSQASYRAKQDHSAYERLMVSLEKSGGLSREVEGLPDTVMMQNRAKSGQYLTRPELAVLMAYTKNKLVEDLVKTDVADDPYSEGILYAYFPKPLHSAKKALAGHRLRREIITSRITNKIVDVCGPLFVMRLIESTDGQIGNIAKAFLIACEALQVDRLRSEIAKLDNQVNSEAQLILFDEISGVIRRVVAWLVRRNAVSPISESIKKRVSALSDINHDWLEILSPYDQKRASGRIKRFEKAGVPRDLATDVALLRSRASGFDVIELADVTKLPIRITADMFYKVGSALKIDRIRSAILTTESTTHWETLAFQQFEEDFFIIQSDFARVLATSNTQLKSAKTSEDVKNAVEKWLKQEVESVKVYDTIIRSMTAQGDWTTAKLSIASSRLRELQSKFT